MSVRYPASLSACAWIPYHQLLRYRHHGRSGRRWHPPEADRTVSPAIPGCQTGNKEAWSFSCTGTPRFLISPWLLFLLGDTKAIGLRGVAGLGKIAEAKSDDPEERRRQQEAQQAASNLGAVIGLTASAIMALKREEREALEREEYNEFIAEQEQRESLRMG